LRHLFSYPPPKDQLALFFPDLIRPFLFRGSPVSQRNPLVPLSLTNWNVPPPPPTFPGTDLLTSASCSVPIRFRLQFSLLLAFHPTFAEVSCSGASVPSSCLSPVGCTKRESSWDGRAFLSPTFGPFCALFFLLWFGFQAQCVLPFSSFLCFFLAPFPESWVPQTLPLFCLHTKLETKFSPFSGEFCLFSCYVIPVPRPSG